MANEDNSNGGVEQSVSQIISEALQKVGVQAKDIQLPPEPTQTPPNVPTLDGQPKGAVFGVLPVEEKTPTKEDAEATSDAELGEKVVPPITKAEIETLLNNTTSKFQSMIDRKINQLNTNMQNTIGVINQFLQSQDDASIAGLPEDMQIKKRLEKLEKGGKGLQIPTQPVDQQPVNYYQNLVNFVDATGLKVDDKRIDWAPDETDPKEGFNRFLGSIKKALVQDQTNALLAIKKEGEKAIQQVRKKTGVDKVSMGGPAGAGTKDIDKMSPFQKLEYAFQMKDQEQK